MLAKAEQLPKGPNPRFIVTNLPEDCADPKALYEEVYCVRGDMENRVKEQQLDLFADRISTGTLRANQLRLWFSSVAYVLVNALRRHALQGSRMANATCGTIRLKLFKIAAQVSRPGRAAPGKSERAPLPDPPRQRLPLPGRLPTSMAKPPALSSPPHIARPRATSMGECPARQDTPAR